MSSCIVRGGLHSEILEPGPKHHVKRGAKELNNRQIHKSDKSTQRLPRTNRTQGHHLGVG